MTNFSEESMRIHRELQGKIQVTLRGNIEAPDSLSTYYTPGVGAVSSYLKDHPDETREYTWINNTVAVISDGSAVLGLGNIGPAASLPVMEGKAMLFKHFADINAVPIVLDVHTPDEIVTTVQAIAPSFGGINLEDIAAPVCFEVEERLKNLLSIPVMHDDQHGTAIAVLAGLINAAHVTGRDLNHSRIVVAGAGAAGTAISKLLTIYSSAEILVVDRKGVLSRNRLDLNNEKSTLASLTNPYNISGNLQDALMGADIFIGVSGPGIINEHDIKTMKPDPIVFALANPDPEILPGAALEAGAAVVATGRSDFPNQINNALVFPGVFRGALDNNILKITDSHKIAAAEAIAGLVKNPTPGEIVPSIRDPRLVPAISKIIR